MAGHPWHDIALPEGGLDEFPAVIEIPRGAKNKYELDAQTGLLRVDRVLYSAVHYPANYGFVPRTLAEDGDPLDVLVLAQEPIVPLAYLSVRALGGFSMRDEKGSDVKIISVPIRDPSFEEYHELADLPRHMVIEIMRFFEDYKVLEGKGVEVGERIDRRRALAIVRRAAEQYRARFPA
jgi:inorganic pyrophosphatase